MMHNSTLTYVVIGVYIASICGLACCGLDKTVPLNYSLLAVFTFCVSWIVSASCMHIQPIIVLEAACLTATVVVAITLYAFTTKTDFTVFGPLIYIFGLVFAVAGLLMSAFGYTHNLLYCSIGAIFFSFYLLFDTQMIMGGDSKRYQFDEDSYILAAVTLYLDIINIFLYILEILDENK